VASRGPSRGGDPGFRTPPAAARGRRRQLRRLAGVLVTALALGLAGPAAADDDEVDWQDYNPRRAGNPVRIAAYVLHPVGVIVDYLVLRPAWWIGQHEPFRTIFGVEDR